MSPRILIFAALALVLAVGGFYYINSNDQSEIALPEIPESIQTVASHSENDGEAPEILEMALGEDSAPVTIIEYASFTCPHCRAFHEGTFSQIKTNYVETGKVKFIVRDVYFDRLGLWASMMARCGGRDRYFGIADLIYRGQKEWTVGDDGSVILQNLMKIGRLAGLNDDQMNACMQDNDKAQALVDLYQKNAERDDIRSTPSFLINGKKYDNMSYTDFAKTLDELLEE